MLKFSQRIDDPNGIVSKLIFEDDTAIAETVAYRYQDRGVICFSCQSGCRIGCKFCGTGNRFIRDLTEQEIALQIYHAERIVRPRQGKLQIMSMSMGEPMFCWNTLKDIAKGILDHGDYFFVSTVGIKDNAVINSMISLGQNYQKFGLQFSLHSIDNFDRWVLLGRNDYLADIHQIINWGREFTLKTGNRAYYNYICTKVSDQEINWLATELSGMHLTCSVLCNTRKLAKASIDEAIRVANEVAFKSLGKVETSMFDPAGQDTIGGGCGQLLYVQEKLKGIH